MKHLEIRLLGTMQLLRGQGPLRDFESNKARALLAYLVVESAAPHQRRKLAALLWPEMPENNALTSLRHALSNLRKVIEDQAAKPPYLLITPQAVQFNTLSNYHLDVAAFEIHAKYAQQNPLDIVSLMKAGDLYQGRFLEGFSIPDSVPFEEWVVIKRERYDQLANFIFKELASYYELIGDYDLAIAFAQRQIALDPWREEAHRLKMRCLYFSGQRCAAIAQFETCCKALAKDLYITPSPDTIALYEEIRDGTLSSPPSPPAFFMRSPSLSFERPKFVSRQKPLNCMHEALTHVLAGEGQVLLVTGGAGQGKTALVKEFIDQVLETHPNLAAAWGNSRAYFGSGDPFLPFREILEMLTGQIEHRWEAGLISHDHARRMWHLTEPSAQALVQYGPELVVTFVPGESLLQRVSYILREEPIWLSRLSELVTEKKAEKPLTKEDIFRQYCRVLIEISHRAPLLLFVDDLQWADQSSLELFFYLSRQQSSAPILLIGAFRPVKSLSSEVGTPITLADMVNELRIQSGDIMIDLDAYTDRNFTDAYLDQEPNQLGEDFREQLFKYTHSHPLYTAEMLFDMKQRGNLIRNEVGEWMVSDSLDWDRVPPRIEAAIQERLSHLPAGLLDLLKIASVEGERFTVEVLAEIQEIDIEGLMNRIREELDQQFRLVQADSSMMVDGNRLTRYRFRHILFQKYLYSQLDVIERAEYHAGVGKAIEKCYAEDLQTLSVPLAIHFELAGLSDKAIHYYEVAARHANRFSSYEDSIRLYNKALSLLARKPETQARNKQELDLLIGKSAPLMFIHGFASDEVGANNDRMVDLLKGVSSDLNLFPLYHAMNSYYIMRARYPIAINLLWEAELLAKKSDQALLINIVNWGLGFTNLWLGNLEEALSRINKMVDYFDPVLHGKLHKTYGIDPGVACFLWSSWAIWLLGFPEQALMRGQQAIDLSNYLGDTANQILALDIVSFLHLLMRKIDGVRELMNTLEVILERNPAPLYMGDFKFLEGLFRFQNGELDVGVSQMHSGVEGYQACKTRSQLSLRMTLLAEAYLANNQWKEAAQMIGQVEDFIEETDERLYQAEVLRLKGELMAYLGDQEKAEACYLDAMQVAQDQKAKTLEMRAAMSMARLWQTQGRIEEAFQVLEGVYSWFTEGFDTPDLNEARKLLEKLEQS